jgi:hypothetical protein
MMVSDFDGINSLLVNLVFIFVTITQEFGYSLDRVNIVDKESHLALFPQYININYCHPLNGNLGNVRELLSGKY